MHESPTRRIRPPVGPAIQAAEHEAAKQRILQQAEAERTPIDDTTQVVPDGRRRREH